MCCLTGECREPTDDDNSEVCPVEKSDFDAILEDGIVYVGKIDERYEEARTQPVPAVTDACVYMCTILTHEEGAIQTPPFRDDWCTSMPTHSKKKQTAWRPKQVIRHESYLVR
jgi:hypothetical protein